MVSRIRSPPKSPSRYSVHPRAYDNDPRLQLFHEKQQVQSVSRDGKANILSAGTRVGLPSDTSTTTRFRNSDRAISRFLVEYLCDGERQ